jgi:hypothetical protein
MLILEKNSRKATRATPTETAGAANITMNNNIVFSDDGDRAYCSSCDYLLIQLKDGSSVCSNISCQRTYNPDSVQKHKSKLGPSKSRYDNEGPELVSITGYTNPNKKIRCL